MWGRLDKDERTASNLAVAVGKARRHFAKISGIIEEQAWNQQVQDWRARTIIQIRLLVATVK